MVQKKQIIIFTDLDGSLLDKDTFKFNIIENYFRELILKNIIIIPNSSKTEAELLDFNKQYNLNLSFIVENGSCIHGLNLISPNLPKKILISRTVDKIYEIYNSNVPNNLKNKITLIQKLNSKKQEEIFGLPSNKLKLAIKRKYTIPIKFNGSQIEKYELIEILNNVGLTLQTGGRIINICDNINKSKAMSKTIELISKEIDDEVVTIGVGDNQNDIEMLKLCDHPCLVRNDNFNSALINIDNLIKSAEPSPMGWADVIKTAIQKIES